MNCTIASIEVIEQASCVQSQLERLQLEKEAARLHSGEFDVKREEHLRKKLDIATSRVLELETELSEMVKRCLPVEG